MSCCMGSVAFQTLLLQVSVMLPENCLCSRVVLSMRIKNQTGDGGQHKETAKVILMNIFPYLPIHPPLQEKQLLNE